MRSTTITLKTMQKVCIYVLLISTICVMSIDKLLSQQIVRNQITNEDALKIGRNALVGLEIEKGWTEYIIDEDDVVIYTFKKVDNKFAWTGGLFSVYIRKRDGAVLKIRRAQ